MTPDERDLRDKLRTEYPPFSKVLVQDDLTKESEDENDRDRY